MKLVVFIKAVPDNTRLQWSGAQPVPTDWMINPLDEYALELALQMKAQTSGHLTVISQGDRTDPLKKALALGADAVYQVATINPFDHGLRAQVLAAAARQMAPESTVWLCGQQSLDTMAGVTGPLIAQLQQWPWLGQVKALSASGTTLQATVDIPEGEQDLSITGPVVLSCIKGATELRSPNIKGVMAANRASVPLLALSDLPLPPAMPDPGLATLSPRPPKAPGRIVTPDTPQAAADLFIAYLQAEGLR
jgi:electron transfer flavoprotein beta subunit